MSLPYPCHVSAVFERHCKLHSKFWSHAPPTLSSFSNYIFPLLVNVGFMSCILSLPDWSIVLATVRLWVRGILVFVPGFLRGQERWSYIYHITCNPKPTSARKRVTLIIIINVMGQGTWQLPQYKYGDNNLVISSLVFMTGDQNISTIPRRNINEFSYSYGFPFKSTAAGWIYGFPIDEAPGPCNLLTVIIACEFASM